MKSIARWDPFRAMRRWDPFADFREMQYEMDRLLDRMDREVTDRGNVRCLDACCRELHEGQ